MARERTDFRHRFLGRPYIASLILGVVKAVGRVRRSVQVGSTC